MGHTKQETRAPAVLAATDGVGPLLERDYWAVVEGSDCSAEDVGQRLRTLFERYAPPETAVFSRDRAEGSPLEIGDELKIHISLVGRCGVRVVHAAPCTLTLRTLRGHPEAGRITFGAEEQPGGRLVLRIRSRTRASGVVSLAGFLLIGKQMQARCWIRFLDRLAADCGGRVEGKIQVRTRQVDEEPGDRADADEPVFTCGEDA